MKKILKNRYICGSILITIIYAIFLIIYKIYPFGENTVLYGDLYAQYINFFCYFKEILQGTKGIFMSWNLGMANDFYTNLIYYLLNPLNIFVVFFDESNMYIFAELLIYVKLLLIFNFFVLYIQKVYNYKKLSSVLFGIAFTFSSFTVTNIVHIMWLDVLYILPISIMFINNYIKKGKLYPVILTYIYMLFIQYYMAYSMIIFCSIYYVVIFWINEDLNKQNLKIFIKKTIPIAVCTILAVGTAMIIFIPAINSVQEITNSSVSYVNTDNLNIIDIIKNMTNRFDDETTQKMGFVFCSSLITILDIHFFVNKKIKRKEKIIFFALIVFMLLPVISPKLYLLWHGGGPTHGANFRYCYLLIFTLVTVGFRAYQNIDITKKSFIQLILFLDIFIIISFSFFYKYFFAGYNTDFVKAVVSLTIILFITVLLFIYSNNKSNIKKIVFTLLIAIEVIESCLIIYYLSFGGTSIEKHNSEKKIIQDVLKNIDKSEIDRVIIENESSMNESLRYNYSTFYYFASGRNLNTLKQMNKLGYNTKYNLIENYSKTVVNDMLSGIRYYLVEYNPELGKIENSINYNNMLELIAQIGENRYLYKNSYAFPFLYYIPNDIEFVENGNILEIQNKILNNYGKQTNEIFGYNIREKNLCTDCYVNTLEKDEEEFFDYTIKYEITALKDVDIYLEHKGDTIMKINYNDYTTYLGDLKMNEVIKWPKGIVDKYYNYGKTVHLSSLKKGEKFSFEIETNKDRFYQGAYQIYAFDDEKIKDKIMSVKQNFNIEKIEKNGLEANGEVEEDGFICFEISYDEGWHIEIDGEEKKTEDIYGCFLGTSISKGSHNIKIYYIPKGFKEGAIISIISLGILICILWIYERHNHFYTET